MAPDRIFTLDNSQQPPERMGEGWFSITTDVKLHIGYTIFEVEESTRQLVYS